jgi:hypothetical protein
VIVAEPISTGGPPQRREGELIRIEEPSHGDPTMTDPPLLGREEVSFELQEGTAVKEAIRFSTAFCQWLRIGGPLL